MGPRLQRDRPAVTLLRPSRLLAETIPSRLQIADQFCKEVVVLYPVSPRSKWITSREKILCYTYP